MRGRHRHNGRCMIASHTKVGNADTPEFPQRAKSLAAEVAFNIAIAWASSLAWLLTKVAQLAIAVIPAGEAIETAAVCYKNLRRGRERATSASTFEGETLWAHPPLPDSNGSGKGWYCNWHSAGFQELWGLLPLFGITQHGLLCTVALTGALEVSLPCSPHCLLPPAADGVPCRGDWVSGGHTVLCHECLGHPLVIPLGHSSVHPLVTIGGRLSQEEGVLSLPPPATHDKRLRNAGRGRGSCFGIATRCAIHILHEIGGLMCSAGLCVVSLLLMAGFAVWTKASL